MSSQMLLSISRILGNYKTPRQLRNIYLICQISFALICFYIQSFSLTECIVIVRVRICWDVCPLSVCASVCASVCSRQYGETTCSISMKLSKNDPLQVYRCAFKFWLINIIGDVTAAIFIEKTRALSRPQFWSDFHEIWCVDSLEKYQVWD